MINSDDGPNLQGFFDDDLEQLLAILARVSPETPKPALASYEEFERRLVRHFDWEENWLFPAAALRRQEAASTLAAMKDEHAAIRALADETHLALRAEDAKTSCKRLARLQGALRAHAVDEGRELFEPLAGAFSPEETAGLLESLPRF